MDIMLPVSLTSAAMFGLLALWLAVRCGRARLKAKVGHGDGGARSSISSKPRPSCSR